ncbi:MAG: DUF4062 domain-containing protein [Parvibaculaceae bacterium]
MEKRFQIFISSTFEDLREERSAVIQALLELDSIPAGMEMFPASDDDQWSLIQQVIDDCDYYIIIVGGRYVSVTPEGISYTEREFDYAVSKSIPILAFTHKFPDTIPAGKSELGEPARNQLQKFRDKVRTNRVVKDWGSPEDLGGQVSRSLVKAIKTHPAEGWIRARHATTPELLGQLNDLREENQKLTIAIERARNEAPRGTEEYASGADEFEISGTFSTGRYSNKVVHEWQLITSWNHVLSKIGPQMFNEASEPKMAAFLARTYFLEVVATIAMPNINEEDINDIALYPEDWQTVIIQMRALALIQKSKKSHGVNDTLTYWTLTPYGEEQLTKLRAIKKIRPTK